MKFILPFLISFASINLQAQKYALLDTHFAQPITYTDTITPMDKLHRLFPIEKKMLPQFINALLEIEDRLSSKETSGELKQYKFGCIEFAGRTVPLASETRIDYVLTSNCDNVNILMHLCDAKISNGSNLFFIKTWINYIQSNLK
ncbi:MAG: hypothetical protein M3Z92_13075 [Bacteroidota bacterium]|nr:hypothetical protein [Bacteroidota bacterium]MDQ6890466.1 hypothetical protein [Bacteroidota bacterium]